MSDLIERLRSAAIYGPVPCPVCDEAADRIAELEAQWKQFEEYDCDELKAANALLDVYRVKLTELIDAAKNLIAVKGRHHTELAYKQLCQALVNCEGSENE